jgi:hypothetical protein
VPALADLALGAGDLLTVVVDVEVIPGEPFVLTVLAVGLLRSGPETVTWCSRVACSRWVREV